MTPGARSAADIAEQPQVLAGVLDRNERQIERVRELVIGQPLVRMLALGSSKHAAGYGSHVLELLASTPATVLPAPGAAVRQPSLDPAHPLIVLSQSGRTPALLEVAERARSSGVEVVAVTNEPGSPLEEIATVTLACGAGAERVVAATKSVTAQMLLLRAVAAATEVDNLVRAVRGAIDVDVAPAIGSDLPSGVVCAGFAAEWIADEIALKLAEMAGVAVTSEAVVEHFHGPRATHAPTLAFLDPADPNSLELAGVQRVTTVGPSARFDLETPVTGNPSLDAIVTIVVGQRIAHAWALQLGEDPDAERGLSKVTRTR